MEIKIFCLHLADKGLYFCVYLPSPPNSIVQITLGVHAPLADANERGGRRLKEGKSFKPLLPRKAMFTNVSAM